MGKSLFMVRTKVIFLGTVQVKANSQNEARKIVRENFSGSNAIFQTNNKNCFGSYHINSNSTKTSTAKAEKLRTYNDNK